MGLGWWDVVCNLVFDCWCGCFWRVCAGFGFGGFSFGVGVSCSRVFWVFRFRVEWCAIVSAGVGVSVSGVLGWFRGFVGAVGGWLWLWVGFGSCGLGW